MTTVNDLPPEATVPDQSVALFIAKDAKPEDKPDAKRPALAAMECDWELPDLLLGRTRAMHAAGETVLIKESKESDANFRRRLKRTVLTNYYGDTIDRHSGLPFASEIQFDPPLPDRMSYLESDADGAKRSITVIARELMREGMHRGLSHVLVDMQPGSGNDYASQLRRRPRMLIIKAPDLLDVRESVSKDGADQVSYARFKQCSKQPAGKFTWSMRHEVMEITAPASDGVKGSAVVWTLDKEGNWQGAQQAEYTPTSIPLFTFYSKQTGEFEAEPAYHYLAELNLAHFQSDADQRHGLSYGRRSTLVKTGWRESVNPADAAAKGQGARGADDNNTLGFGRQIVSREDGAKAYFLETGGGGLAAGFTDLEGLERRMERFGAAQVSRDAGITATSRRLDNARDTCNLEAWCTRMEQVLLAAVRAVAQMLGMELPAGQKVMIDRSFADDTPAGQDAPMIVDMGKARLLTTRTVIAELKARGKLVTVKDPEEEANAIAEEASNNVDAEMQKRAAELLAQRGGATDPNADPNADPAGGGQTP